MCVCLFLTTRVKLGINFQGHNFNKPTEMLMNYEGADLPVSPPS